LPIERIVDNKKGDIIAIIHEVMECIIPASPHDHGRNKV
jgi:hypothetical protein